MRNYRTAKSFVVVGLIVVLGLFDSLVACATSTNIEVNALQFVSYIQAGMAEQDVYLEIGDGMGKRVEGSDSLSSITQMIYAASEPHAHDPFGISNAPVGPFSIGSSLGITLGQWLGATGSGTYKRVHDPVYGDTAEISLTLAGLVPKGVYTLFECMLGSVVPGAEGRVHLVVLTSLYAS